jgi:hypothetical protein
MGLMRKKLRFGGTTWLRELKCFSGIEDDDLIDKLLAVAHVERFPEGAIIANNGVADALRIIVEGSVEVLFSDDIEPTVLVDGEYFGFSLSLGTSLYAEATEARTLSAVELHVLHEEDVQMIVNQRTRCAWPAVGEKPLSGRPCTPCLAQLSMTGGLLSARLATPWHPGVIADPEGMLSERLLSAHLGTPGQPGGIVDALGDGPATPGDNDRPVFDAWSWGWAEPSEAWVTPRFPDGVEEKPKSKSGNKPTSKQRRVRRPRQLSDIVPPLSESLRDDLENLPGDCTWPVLGGSPSKLPGSFGNVNLVASPKMARDEPFFLPASARYPMSPIKSPMKTPCHRGLMSPAKMSHRRRRAC